MVDMWSPTLNIGTWTLMSLLSVFSYEVTVKNSDLKRCEDDNMVCVTNLRDCGPPPPSYIQKTLNMSCYCNASYTYLTCELSEMNSLIEPDIAFIFRSMKRIFSCKGIFNPSGAFNITARMRNYIMGTEIRSQPHTVNLYESVKPSEPVLTVLGSDDVSVAVSWKSSSDGSCRLRYRVNDTQTWSQPPDFLRVPRDKELVHTVKDLLPFTVYRAAVACRRDESGIWSNWSPDVTVTTLERVPSRPPEVCYRVERNDSGESLLLHLMWKGLDLHEARGRILGYQVSYEPVTMRHLQDRLIRNVTGVMDTLVVEEGNYSVTVTAFNAAGYGPAANLSIDTHRQNNLLSVRNLWVSSSFPAVKGLQVQWESPTAPPSVLPVSHFVVQWHSETRPSTSRWSPGDRFNTSIEDVDPDDSYMISVFPIYKQQCGSPRSLPASLQHGALMAAVDLDVVKVTKTLVTVEWSWQRKSGVRVNRYSVILRKKSDRQNTETVGAVTLWPDQRQHTFPNLKPHTEYSLFLLADNFSSYDFSITTDFDEVPVVATATPLLLLLAVTVLVISILSRTVYKSYFFPFISSPQDSTTGQWLMDPNHQKYAEGNILDIKDFQVTDVLGEKGIIVVRPNSDLHEDTSLLPLSHLIVKLSTLDLDTEYVSEAALTTEHQLQSFHPDYAVNCHHPEGGVVSEERQQPDAALLHQVHETDGWFPRKEEGTRQHDLSQKLHQNTVKHSFSEFRANADSGGVNQMTCDADYLMNSSFLGKTGVEKVTGQTDSSYLMCETDYIASSCFAAKIPDVDRASVAC
ncbi:interleukin-6 receptor subunit beta-like [Seriola dumerili]|uniref:Interleukin-6 receptor subunit beta-like n=1 Tax=Seriola dumerili TaxID=41447 RepID=A0A3B4UKP3_SERDU|nr:interleukin-6 receptor subunit beta-like [Seriola dumerili]XP_022623830.1 interleukin-6 receptor subunit beta-like [Seriola dumerili]XP_022623831.1 interleukin-6 receptor subunit beta-like [Seriola dumerili]